MMSTSKCQNSTYVSKNLFKYCSTSAQNMKYTALRLKESLNGKSKHKIPAPVVAIRVQQRRTEGIHVKRRDFELAAILNWFGSEHLHPRFGCQEHHF